MSFLTSRDRLAPRGIGKSIPRREDARLLTGAGQYASDFRIGGQVHACLVRSPHAHAAIIKIDVAGAIGAPGVLAVLTGSDAAADDVKPIPHSPVPTNPHEVPLRNRDGSGFFIAPHPILAGDAVRYVGEPVAIVVAETLAEAIDAAERVGVVYEPAAAVAGSRDALLLGAPLVWEQHGSNLCIDSEAGDKEAAEAAFARAAHVVRLDTTINRVTGVPMELRAAIGVYDEPVAQFTVYTSAGGGVIRQRDDIAGALGGTEGRGASGLGRCRREFRDPQQYLPGVCVGRVGCETRRPAGQVGVRAA
jgi:carbon-monoxide dehydrogenase large subunit